MKKWLPLLLCVSSLSLFAHEHHGARDYLKEPDAWFGSAEGNRVTANILSYQAQAGGWPKNQDNTAKLYDGDKSALKGTFDNGATTDELRYLARAYSVTQAGAVKAAFLRGYDHILQAQYPTGGWPQYYPPSKQYHRHITFNDDAMTRLLNFLRESWTDSKHYALLDEERKTKAHVAFDKGIQCILKCQIKVNGKLTAWCAQHDELDYSPRPARTFELVSISGAESVGVVRLLMSLEQPSAEIIAAVDAAAAWFADSKISNTRVDTVDDPAASKGKNKVVVEDPAAPPIWARFYDLKTNRPIFSDRDGVAKSKLSEIGYERRNGYAWYGNWPQKLLESEYPAWKARHRLP